MSLSVAPAIGSWNRERTFLSLSGEVEQLPADHFARAHRLAFDYWNDRRGRDHMPPKSAIDPVAIPFLLPNIALWDATSDGDYRCRLSGSEIDMSLGAPLKGVVLSQLPCSLLEEAQHEFDEARAGKVSFAERTAGWAGKPHLYYRHLLLPLAGPAHAIDSLLSILTFHPITERLRINERAH